MADSAFYIANVALTNSFDDWRLRTNSIINKMNALGNTQGVELVSANVGKFANVLVSTTKIISSGNTDLANSIVLIGDGSNTVPKLTFLNDKNTGIIRPAPDTISFVVGGAIAATVNTAGFHVSTGNVFANGIIFNNDVDTYIRRTAPDTISLFTGGSSRIVVTTANTRFTTPVHAPNGSAAAPSVSFSGNKAKGFYSAGQQVTGYSTHGVQRFRLSSNGIESSSDNFNLRGTANVIVDGAKVYHKIGGTNVYVVNASNVQFQTSIHGPGGSAASPSYSFLNDKNTGFFNAGAENFAITSQGGIVARFNSSNGYIFGTDSDTYMRRAGENNIAFFTGGTQRIRFNANGLNFGTGPKINSPRPNALAFISGSTEFLRANTTQLTANLSIIASNRNSLIVRNTANVALHADSDGNGSGQINFRVGTSNVAHVNTAGMYVGGEQVVANPKPVVMVKFAGTDSAPITAIASRGVANVEKLSTGSYRIHFSTPMANSNYFVNFTSGSGIYRGVTTTTNTYVQVSTHGESSGSFPFTDHAQIFVSVETI